jgi:hypothetical protein
MLLSIFLLGGSFLLYLYFQTTTTQEGFSFVFDKDRIVNDGTYNIPDPKSTSKAGAKDSKNPGNGDQSLSAKTCDKKSGSDDSDNLGGTEKVDKSGLPVRDIFYSVRRFFTYDI